MPTSRGHKVLTARSNAARANAFLIDFVQDDTLLQDEPVCVLAGLRDRPFKPPDIHAVRGPPRPVPLMAAPPPPSSTPLELFPPLVIWMRTPPLLTT